MGAQFFFLSTPYPPYSEGVAQFTFKEYLEHSSYSILSSSFNSIRVVVESADIGIKFETSKKRFFNIWRFIVDNSYFLPGPVFPLGLTKRPPVWPVPLSPSDRTILELKSNNHIWYVNESYQSSIFTHKTNMLISICLKCFLAFNELHMTRTDGWIQNF